MIDLMAIAAIDRETEVTYIRRERDWATRAAAEGRLIDTTRMLPMLPPTVTGVAAGGNGNGHGHGMRTATGMAAASRPSPRPPRVGRDVVRRLIPIIVGWPSWGSSRPSPRSCSSSSARTGATPCSGSSRR